jgi:ribulose kinase
MSHLLAIDVGTLSARAGIFDASGCLVATWSAMVAAVASGLQPDLFLALDVMAPAQQELRADTAWSQAHNDAYRAYLTLFSIRNEIDAAGRCAMRPRAANASGGSPNGIPEA